uniref:Uncharacterized protein n=1 Tax=Arundo donax TaxID=35708 RepID=A0A0A9EG89_ARUDO
MEYRFQNTNFSHILGNTVVLDTS